MGRRRMMGGLTARAYKYPHLMETLGITQTPAPSNEAQADSDQKTDKEMVNHPDHYGGDTVYETVKVLEAWMTPDQFIGFLRGSVHRYTSRAGKKDPDKTIEDLEKAITYLQFEIDYRKRTGKERGQ